MEVIVLSRAEAEQALPTLIELLQDAVASGASVGFLAPLSEAVAHAYWQKILAKLDASDHYLLVAHNGEQIVGTVQLVLAGLPNSTHRAEVSKLLVHSAARGHGIGTQLMQALESVAQREQRTLLVLDTLTSNPAERLYERLGYQCAGVIPDYARCDDGLLYATSVMYKRLDFGA